MEKIVDALQINNCTDVHHEADTMKPRSSMISGTVDGNNDCESITNMFSDKYNMLHNSVPYDKNEMKCIENHVTYRETE